MIQDISPSRYDVGFQPRAPLDDDYVMVMRDKQVLMTNQGEMAYLPRLGDLAEQVPALPDNLVYLFRVDDRAYFLHTAETSAARNGFFYRDSQAFRDMQPSWMAFAGITACHLAAWYGRHRFCGGCGQPMLPKTAERALLCSHCGEVVYPTIAPAVIVGVVDGERLLMTRYANRPYSKLALVAGFVEVGETLEDTVRREVLEEVGVRVGAIRYYKSQPWAFSGSLLVGFYAELDGSPEITMDAAELQEALWLERSELPKEDSGVSLTGEMIAVFRDGKA